MTRHFVACLIAGLCAALPSAGSAACRGALPPGLEAWVAFELDFEGGNLRARSVGGAREPAKVLGDANFVPGRFGRALRLGEGGARIHFDSAGTLDFTRPGGLSFWLSPRSWERTSNAYVTFFVTGTPGGASFNLQRDARRAGVEKELIPVGLFALPGGRRMHFLRMRTEPWKRGSWHFVALRWDRLSFAISIDGGDFVQQGVPDGEWQRHFSPQAPGARWRIGDAKGEGSAIDEFRIYSRPVRDAEARAMFGAKPGQGCSGKQASAR